MTTATENPVLITDTGFGPDTWTKGWQDWDLVTQSGGDLETGFGLDVPNTLEAAHLQPYFEQAAAIRIPFPSFADGRGFSLARHLRLLGYRGRLRAAGHVIADQYTMARRCGFDEVEIPADLAQRQPEPQWLARANWQDHGYRARLQQAG